MWFAAPSSPWCSATRSSIVRSAPDRRPRRLPQASAPHRAQHRGPGSRPHGRAHPLLGFLNPPTTWASWPASPGVASPGTFRPRGLSPPRRFPSRSLRGLVGRCRPWVPSPFRGRFGHRASLPPRRRDCAASRSIAAGVSAPPALRNRRWETPRRRIARGPCDLEGTSADVHPEAPGRPPPEHFIPSRCGDRRRRDPPRMLFPAAPSVRRALRAGISGSVRSGTGGSA
jgi:hypothetical protein